jgi:hypothetical protein
VRLAFLVFLAACGGGNVDPGFTGPLPSDAPRGTAAPADVGAREPPSRFDRPKLVVISAAWCGVCQEVLPGLMVGYAPFEGAVDLLVLDVTDDRAIRRSIGIARAEGVSDFFAQYLGRTPTVGVFTKPEQPRLVRGPVHDPAHVRRELEAAIERMKSEQLLETDGAGP